MRRSFTLLMAGLLWATAAPAIEPIDHPAPEQYAALVRQRLEEARDRFDAARAEGQLSGEDYGELAMVYDANDLPEPAAQAYRNAMEVARFDARWPYFLAQIAYKQGRFDRAVELFRRSLELNPDYVPTQIRLGIALIEQSELAAATQVLEPLVREHPEIAVAHAELGKALLQLGEHEAALEHLLKAAELQPMATRLNYQIGTALRALGRTEEARERLEQAGDAELSFGDPLNEGMRRRSGSSNYWHNLAQRTLATGDRATAMRYLETAVLADPSNVYPHFTLAMTLAEMDRMDVALDLMQQYRERNPDEPLAAFALGLIHAAGSRDEQALSLFEAAHEANPDMIEPILMAGHTAMRMQRFRDAAGWYAQGLRLTPNDLTLTLRQATAYFHAGECRQAMDALVLAVPLAPENPDLLRTYARVAATCDQATAQERENALNASRNLYRLSVDPFTVDTLAVVEAGHGRHEVAEELLAQAIFQAVRDGEDEQVEALKVRLKQAQDRQLTARPWPPGHPLVTPPRPDLSLPAAAGQAG